jgi:hypothetical protein
MDKAGSQPRSHNNGFAKSIERAIEVDRSGLWNLRRPGRTSSLMPIFQDIMGVAIAGWCPLHLMDAPAVTEEARCP